VPQAFDAGVVDGAVEAAEARDGLLHQRVDVGAPAHVAADEMRRRAERARRARRLLAGRGGDVGHDDPRACPCEREGSRAPDAGRGPGHERGLSVEIVRHQALTRTKP
jgi:hypothetical protein